MDPVNCPVGSVLEFLQHKFLAGAAATTLRVYVAAIAARRDTDDVPLDRHRLVSSFMRSAKCLRPVRPPSFPSWDLSVALKGLLGPPFEPLEWELWHGRLHFCWHWPHSSMWVILQALSVSESCTEFAPGQVKTFLRPRPTYVPNVLSTSFRSHVVVLQAFFPSPSSEGDDHRLLCPVRALKMYVDRSSLWRQSIQLLVYFGVDRKGLPAAVCLHP